MATHALGDVRSHLLRWFDRHQRDLPWRRTRDPYAIWLSEVMLQQTQVTTVLPYWERFLSRYPTLPALADAPLPDVLSQWRGLGYYSRARNLHRAAQEVVERHGGKLPADLEALRALPGFGRYTAGAVASIAFGLQAPLVDGNVARVFSRLFEVEGEPGDKQREAKLWALAEALVQGERPGDLNQALMELGALVCRPDPTCLLCPVRDICLAFRHQRVDELPPKKKRAARKALALSVALWRKRDTVLLARRREGGLFGGLWELPSVETAGPVVGDAEQALSAVLGVPLTLGAQLCQVERTLTHRDLALTVFAARGKGKPSARAPYAEVGWFSPAQAAELGMSTAMVKALQAALQAPSDPGSAAS